MSSESPINVSWPMSKASRNHPTLKAVRNCLVQTVSNLLFLTSRIPGCCCGSTESFHAWHATWIHIILWLKSAHLMQSRSRLGDEGTPPSPHQQHLLQHLLRRFLGATRLAPDRGMVGADRRIVAPLPPPSLSAAWSPADCSRQARSSPNPNAPVRCPKSPEAGGRDKSRGLATQTRLLALGLRPKQLAKHLCQESCFHTCVAVSRQVPLFLLFQKRGQ